MTNAVRVILGLVLAGVVALIVDAILYHVQRERGPEEWEQAREALKRHTSDGGTKWT